MLIKDDNEYIKKLFKKYSVGNFQHYIDIKNYDFLKTSSMRSQFYRHKKNPNLILKINNVESFSNIRLIKLLYSKDGNIENKLEYYRGIPNKFYCNKFFKTIDQISWQIDENINYNTNEPSEIHYDEDGIIRYIEWTNKKGEHHNIEFPACLVRNYVKNGFFCYYKVNGFDMQKKYLDSLIDDVKNGKVKKNINRYSNIYKLKIFKEIAEYYNLINTVEAINNRLLVFKLEGKKV